MNITARTLDAECALAMTARARNTRQALILQTLRRYVPPSAGPLIAELIASNEAEGRDEQQLAGDLEKLASAARGITAPPAPRARPIGVKHLAHLVREHDDAGTLAALLDEHGARLSNPRVLAAVCHEVSSGAGIRLIALIGAGAAS